MKFTYLLVEDDLDFRTVLSQSLERLGYSTFGVGSLAEAYESLTTHSFDRLILDLKLDRENGIDFFKRLSQFPDLKVLVLSGYASVDTVRAALIGGAVNFLQKPASIQEILKAFDGATDGASDGASLFGTLMSHC